MTQYIAYIHSLLFKRNSDNTGFLPRIDHPEQTQAAELYRLMEGEPTREQVEQAIEKLSQYAADHPELRKENLPLFRLTEDLDDRRRDVPEAPAEPDTVYTAPAEAPKIPGKDGAELSVADVRKFYQDFRQLMYKHGLNMKNPTQSCLLKIDNALREDVATIFPSFAFAEYDTEANDYKVPIPAPTLEQYQQMSKDTVTVQNADYERLNAAYETQAREWIRQNATMPDVDFDAPDVQETAGYKIFANLAKAAADGRLFLQTDDYAVPGKPSIFGADGHFITYSKNGNLLFAPNLLHENLFCKRNAKIFMESDEKITRAMQQHVLKENQCRADGEALEGFFAENGDLSENMRHFDEADLFHHFELLGQRIGEEPKHEQRRGYSFLKKTAEEKESLPLNAETVRKVLNFGNTLQYTGLNYPANQFDDIPQNQLAFDEKFMKLCEIYRQARNGEARIGKDLLTINEYGDAVRIENFEEKLKTPEQIDAMLKAAQKETDPKKKEDFDAVLQGWFKDTSRSAVPAVTEEDYRRASQEFETPQPAEVPAPGAFSWFKRIISFGLAKGDFTRYEQYQADKASYDREKKTFFKEKRNAMEAVRQYESFCREVCSEVFDFEAFSHLADPTVVRRAKENPNLVQDIKDMAPGLKEFSGEQKDVMLLEGQKLSRKRVEDRKQREIVNQREKACRKFCHDGSGHAFYFPSCTDTIFKGQQSMRKLTELRNSGKAPTSREELGELLTDIILKQKVDHYLDTVEREISENLQKNDLLVTGKLNLNEARREISHNISLKGGMVDNIMENFAALDGTFLNPKKDASTLYEAAVTYMADKPAFSEKLRQTVFRPAEKEQSNDIHREAQKNPVTNQLPVQSV